MIIIIVPQALFSTVPIVTRRPGAVSVCDDDDATPLPTTSTVTRDESADTAAAL